MRIELRDENRRPIGRVQVDASQRPTRVTTVGASSAAPGEREVFLNWDTAVDDAGQLRRCVACGCTEMFRERAFPQVTAIVVVLAFTGAIIGALGLAANTPVLIAMAIVLVLDVAILLFSRKRLVCYRCRSTYHELPIARYHRPWDRSRADRVAAHYAGPGAAPATVPTTSALAPAPAPAAESPPQPKPKSYFA
jgi:hypothetical protein